MPAKLISFFTPSQDNSIEQISAQLSALLMQYSFLLCRGGVGSGGKQRNPAQNAWARTKTTNDRQARA
ncbi:hypothetical protein AG1IA_10454 [Rhizoctonia solani AG-1 IA]|uniref:Uncharacterized protein n=1 Tax=Thanatephorus cucumeris (strain AG1-IA) TaxID=983506 RepID=L8WBG7_THACA|nr:hypothetical protein AG1IA_10454 [Rhizoctonia solani AG-1 IA]